MDMNFDGTDDIMDTRDITVRIQELKDEWSEVTENDFEDYNLSYDDLKVGLSEEDAEELLALMELQEEAGSSYFDNEESFISDEYFTEYAQDMIKDVGYISAEVPSWIEIDWERTAQNVRMDYTSFEFRGTTYWIR